MVFQDGKFVPVGPIDDELLFAFSHGLHEYGGVRGRTTIACAH
jgi:hypothetical protein